VTDSRSQHRDESARSGREKPTPAVPRWLTPTGLPRWLTLAFVQLAGFALLVAGCLHVFHGGTGVYVGFMAFFVGREVLVRPAARRPPWTSTISNFVIDLIDRLRRDGPPDP
jgi:hypothetical protein